MTENINILLALLGVSIHLLMKFNTRTNKACDFSFKFWLQDNWVNVMLSMLSAIAVLFMLQDVSMFVGNGVEGLTKIVAFCAGFFNHSLIRAVTKRFKKAMEIE
tara:strand:- start:272 stop:583 length:312 start_codon:yes stop_codon:yes gene_type:complete